MQKAEFDMVAGAYAQEHQESISISGELPDFFAEYKVVDAKKIAVLNGLDVSAVLDFGSGIGNSLPYFRMHFPQARLLGADVSRRSIEIAQTRFPGIAEYALIENDNLPLADDSFDLAFAACVFHHIDRSEHGHWLNELHRTTRRGGRLILFEHNPYNPFTLAAVRKCSFDQNAVLIAPRILAKAVTAAGWDNAAIDYRLFFTGIVRFARPIEELLTWLPLGAQYRILAQKT